jgi:hypothetical protein
MNAGILVSEWLPIKARAAWRYGVTHSLASAIPLYIVNEFPRSGGTWLSRMLGLALDLPINRWTFQRLRPSVVHCCYAHPSGLRNVTVLWRDGRDALVSLYHHVCIRAHDGNNSVLVETVGARLPFKDLSNVKENLPAFIACAFTRKIAQPRFSWTEFVRNWAGRRDVVYARYEDLRAHPVQELQRICRETAGKEISEAKVRSVVDEMSFERQTGRKPGEEDKSSLARRGIAGDWKNYFSKEACQVFDHFAGTELVSLGYEKDRNWF